MDVLSLEGMQFHGFHGTEEWERTTGCRFELDVELHGDLSRAAATDRLEDAIDYRQVHSLARSVVEGETHELVERVAGRLMEEMMARFGERTERIVVRLAKCEARVGGINRAAVVRLDRTRDEWTRRSSPDLASGSLPLFDARAAGPVRRSDGAPAR